MRMNAGFEMIWCDFESDTLRLVEHINVTAPLLHGPILEDVAEDEGTDIGSYLSLLPTMISLSQATQTNNPTERNPAMPPNFRHDAAREPFIRSQGWG